MFIPEVINVKLDYFSTLNVRFVLYLKMFCLRKIDGKNQNFENWRRFFLSLFC